MTIEKARVIIVGAGRNGKVIENILSLNPTISVEGFLDDKISESHVIGKIADFTSFHEKGCRFFVAIGDPKWRKEAYQVLEEGGAHFVQAIHPSAIIEKNVTIGKNVMIGANTYINTGTSIGDNTLINNGCIIEHDNTIGSHTNVNPGVITGGTAKIGDDSVIGMGSLIRDKISIGNSSIIGMGTVVTENIGDHMKVITKRILEASAMEQ